MRSCRERLKRLHCLNTPKVCFQNRSLCAPSDSKGILLQLHQQVLGTCLGGRGKEELVLLVGESRLGSVAQGTKRMAREINSCLCHPALSQCVGLHQGKFVSQLFPKMHHLQFYLAGVHTEFSYRMSRNFLLCEKDKETWEQHVTSGENWATDAQKQLQLYLHFLWFQNCLQSLSQQQSSYNKYSKTLRLDSVTSGGKLFCCSSFILPPFL